MIVIYMQGRLGNQLFQYAAARMLQQKYHEEVLLDYSDIERNHKTKDDGWEDALKYFNTSYNIISTNYTSGSLKCIKKINYYASRINLRIWEKSGKRIPKNAICYWIENLFGIHIFDTGYVPIKLNKRCKLNYYQGYFESPKYFEGLESILFNELTPKFPPKKENKGLYRVIEENESICVSVRRGDFFSDKNANIYGICGRDYFLQGVRVIRERFPNAVVIAFSDDIEWVKRNLDFGSKVFYESGKDEVWEKLRLMYSCKHFVISNSTFSWWAQYLSRNRDKIVIAPNVWRRDGKKCAIYQESWIRLEK